MSPSLFVNEIFFSIQGESSYSGYPCSFIRLAGCDLRCVWCDTEYAFHEGDRLSIEEILKRIEQFPGDLVEVTGGEPLLQANTLLLVSSLIECGKRVLIETGGHRDISLVPSEATLIYDIKCPDSGMADRNRWENLALLRPQDEVKFVLASRSDYGWACTQLERSEIREHIVHFSPVWSSLSPEELARWILEDGLQVHLQLQIHKILWGETRGV